MHASDSEPESRDADGLQERACELLAARALVARGGWPLVPWRPRPVERASAKRFITRLSRRCPAVFAARRWLQDCLSHRQTLGRWAKISAKIATDRQIYASTLYLEDTTASFNGYGWEDICLDS